MCRGADPVFSRVQMLRSDEKGEELTKWKTERREPDRPGQSSRRHQLKHQANLLSLFVRGEGGALPHSQINHTQRLNITYNIII